MTTLSRVTFGVIQDARSRQRRRRRWLAAGMTPLLVVVVVAAMRLSVGPTPAPPRTTTQVATAACLLVPSSRSTASPGASVLSPLGVLGRPRTSADAVPASLLQTLPGASVFVDYTRLARVVWGRSFYVVPARFTGCARLGVKPHDGVMLLCIQRAGERVLNAGGGGESTPAQIIRRGTFLVGGSCLHSDQATLIAGIVPDPVASITLRYPSATITAKVVNNVVVAKIPHPGGPLWRPAAMTWRTANGRVFRTFTSL